MKSALLLWIPRLFAVMISLFVLLPQAAYAETNPINIREWQVKWIPKDVILDDLPSASGAWLDSSFDHPLNVIPVDARGLWVRFTIPSTMDWQRPGILVDRLYGLELAVYQGSQLLSESKRDFKFDLNKLLLPIDTYDKPTDFYIRILTTSDRAGLISGIQVDDFETLSHRFVSKDLPDVLLGCSITFLALIMLFCSRYLHRNLRGSWISLSLVALTIGTLIFCYSPLPYIYFKEHADMLLLLFDISLFVFIPSFNYYVDKVFEGKHRFFTRFKHLQTGYSAFCLVALFIYMNSGGRLYEVYYFFSNIILGKLILLQLLFIIGLSLLNAFKGNKNAVILSIGIFLFALSGAADFTFYYISDKTYVLFLWKFGVVAMIFSLVLILARRISSDYVKLFNYSKELEHYNHSLQRTEKMKIISDLAASVAHEVRNPLQVTRGFLQLLSRKTSEKDKRYFDLATNELDRASEIITDFLTFAKPELDTIRLLDLSAELVKIEAMMTPMAAMHGVAISFSAQENLYFYGNTSKLKQAFINIIKNSIEATSINGLIKINAFSEKGAVTVLITDNGEGMDEEEIAKLGVPYFSTKTKGTGLGTMVTFRIIEVMKGTIHYHSVKTKGTEVVIRFPLAALDSVLPNNVGT